MSVWDLLCDPRWELSLVPAAKTGALPVLPAPDRYEAEAIVRHLARPPGGMEALRLLLARGASGEVFLGYSDDEVCRRLAGALTERLLAVVMRLGRSQTDQGLVSRPRNGRGASADAWLDFPLITEDRHGRPVILDGRQMRLERGEADGLGWERLPIATDAAARRVANQLVRHPAGLARLNVLAAAENIGESGLAGWAASLLATGRLKILFRWRPPAEFQSEGAPAARTSVPGSAGSGNRQGDRSRDSSRAAAAPKTWIELFLVDSDGNPVPDEPYEIKLPNGQLVTGMLDAKGRARHDGIDPGMCRVSFPNIHADEWALAPAA